MTKNDIESRDQIIEDLSDRVDVLEKKRKDAQCACQRLGDKLQDYEDDFRAKMAEPCENDDKQHCSCVSHVRKRINELEYEVERLHSMSTIEMMWENQSVHDHVVHWEGRCLRAEAEVERLKAHTWEQERAVILQFAMARLSCVNIGDLQFFRKLINEILYSIEKGEHWPTKDSLASNNQGEK